MKHLIITSIALIVSVTAFGQDKFNTGILPTHADIGFTPGQQITIYDTAMNKVAYKDTIGWHIKDAHKALDALINIIKRKDMTLSDTASFFRPIPGTDFIQKYTDVDTGKTGLPIYPKTGDFLYGNSISISDAIHKTDTVKVLTYCVNILTLKVKWCWLSAITGFNYPAMNFNSLMIYKKWLHVPKGYKPVFSLK